MSKKQNNYDRPQKLPEPQEATVVDIAEPGSWQVKFQASYWLAKPYDRNHQTNFQLGDSVWVVAMHGNGLLIVPGNEKAL
ncbi:NfeD family protein [Laspinema sp. D1]|uniref:NfeD family protein n=1 Tax=Laspinema palackyanum TaxID=3231601 RepID=UPI0034999E4E|nr:NfeD family protein [Laspinema sp. D2b]